MRSCVRSSRIICALVAVLAAAGVVSGQQSLLVSQGQVIVYSGANNTANGDLAPGLANGERFGGSAGPDSPVISDDGSGLFRVQLVSNTGTALSPTYLSRAYYYGDSKGNLVKVLRGGDPEPSGTIANAILSTSSNGVAFTSAPRITTNGLMMFGATIWDPVGSTITSADDTVLYLGSPGAFQILAREGDFAPGCGGATYTQAFSGMSQQPTCVNDAGNVLFQSSLAGATATPPVVTGNNAAWFTGTVGNVQLMLRKGDSLPGGDGSVVSALGFISQMNALGWVVTDVSLLLGSGTSAVTASNNQALWLYQPGIGLTQLLREGDATPIPGTTYNVAGDSWFVNAGASSFNVNGEILINADLMGAVTTGVDDRALIKVSPAGQSVVMRRGDAAPGTGGANFNLVHNTNQMMNDSGTVAFQSTITGAAVTTTNDTGIWIGTPNNWTLVAREGDVAPGTGGQTFGNTMGLFMIMNGSGQLLFNNTLSGGFSSLWSWDPVVGLQAVQLFNDAIEVQPGVFQTAFTVGGVQFTNGATRPLSFANDGTTVVRVGFNDGSSAVMSVKVGSLRGLPGKISEAAGGTHTLLLNAGAAHAGEIYVVAGTASGTFPGTPIGAYVVPLNIDPYTDLTLQSANVGPFVNTFATLNSDGRATAQIVIPPAVPGIAGIVVHHAYGVLDLAGNLVFASEAARLEITP